MNKTNLKFFLKHLSSLRLGRLVTLLFMTIGWPLLAADFMTEIKKDTKEISKYPSHVTGSKGCRETAEYLKNSLASLKNVKVVSQKFELNMPVYFDCSMQVFDQGKTSEYPIFPFWPNNVRLNATPPKGITGRPVFATEYATRLAQYPA